MNKNVKKLSAIALLGFLGLGVTSTQVSAVEPSKNTDVFYTTQSTGVDADGKVVMVVPAKVSLNKANSSQDIEVTMQTSDENAKLPMNFKATVKVSSENKGKLKTDTPTALTKEVDYILEKQKQNINLSGTEVEFHKFEVDPLQFAGGTNSVEQQATIKVEQANVNKLEEEKPGVIYKDKLTFKVTNLSGDGLHTNLPTVN